MDDGSSKDIVFRLNYDNRFDWGYWNTRGMTRSANDSTTTSPKVIASGKFAK